ncbi:MAG: hypothetical protein JSU81_05560 [Candidatus Coatesbacteria bacterium]|nr:MAG: hypothetical protein JSU81_05560 [Candidatus Coatesbacteria bacterium]
MKLREIRSRRRAYVTAAAVGAALAAAGVGCWRPAPASSVKPPEAYRADLYAITARLNDYLAENSPENTGRAELQQMVGDIAHEYTKLAAEARPLRGKTGEPAYGGVAALADDGAIVAGNLAGAVTADPERHSEATAKLAAAVADWVAYNDALAESASAGSPFEPNPWWELPAWRRARGAPFE